MEASGSDDPRWATLTKLREEDLSPTSTTSLKIRESEDALANLQIKIHGHEDTIKAANAYFK
jgi:hypothetical protein